MEVMDEYTTESETSASASNDRKTEEEGEMTKETTLHLISLVKSYGCLWNEKDPDFRKGKKKTDAWERISRAMGRSKNELKTKWDSIRNCYVTCNANHLSNIIKHKWFAYSALQFLDSKSANDTPQQTQQIIEETDAEIIDQLVKSFSSKRSLQLINLIKKYDCLWNRRRPEYKNLVARKDAWNEISFTMGYAPNVLRTKWQCLRNFHRSFTARLVNKLKDGVSPLKMPSWYAFDAMGFLASSYECRPKWAIFLRNKYKYSDSETEEDNRLESEKMTNKNVGDFSPSQKSVKLTTVTPQLHTIPQNHLDIPNDNVPNPPPRIQKFFHLERSIPSSSVHDPLRIVRKVVPAQLGQTVTSATNQSSAKSFVNLVEHELNELSADYAAKAQVEIYRIIGKFKLKDSNRKKARIQLQKNSTAEYRTHYQLPELQLEKPQPVKILAVHRIEAQPDNPIVIIPDLPTEVKTEPAS